MVVVVRNKQSEFMRLAQRQKGQSLTEFVIVCIILVPLFVLVPLLGKYIDMNHATIKASRYVAWERAVGRGDGENSAPNLGEVARETRRRYFSNETLAIKTRDGSEDGSAADKNPLWVHGQNKPLLKSFDDVKVGLVEGVVPPISQEPISAALISRFARNFNLRSTGVFTATVQADVGKGDAQNSGFQNLRSAIPLTFNARTAIIGDVWAARDKSQVATNVRGGKFITNSNVPQSPIVNDITATALLGLYLFEPAVRNFQVQRVVPDIVPANRLGPYPSAGQ
jgi:hypothetical protein